MNKKENLSSQKTLLGKIRELSFAKKLLLLLGINIGIDTVSVLTDEDTFRVSNIQWISGQLHMDHRSGIFAPIFLKVHQKSALDNTFAYNVRQIYSRHFDTWKALDQNDYKAIKEDLKKELKTYLETVLYGIDYFENKVDRTTSFPTIQKIEIHGTTSPEASGKWKNTYLPGVINKENLALGSIRADEWENILFEVLQELGIDTVLSEKTTQEVQYTNEELEKLDSLAREYNYEDIDALHEEYNFGSWCTDNPALKAAMDSLVAAKRNIFISVHFAGERDEVVVLPIRNLFLLLPFLRRRRKKSSTQSNEQTSIVSNKDNDENLLWSNPVEVATYLFTSFENLRFAFILNPHELQKLEIMKYEEIENIIHTLLLPYKIDTAYIQTVFTQKDIPLMFFDDKFASIKEKKILDRIALYVYKLQHFPDASTTQEYLLEPVNWVYHYNDATDPITPPLQEKPIEVLSTEEEDVDIIIPSKTSSSFNRHKQPSWTTQHQKHLTTHNLVTLFQASKKQQKGKSTSWLPNNLSQSWLVIKQPRQFRKDNHRPYWNKQKGNRKWRNGQWNKQSM